MAGRIEFDWDDENKKHLDAHKVAPAEFEQLLNNDPVDLNFELIDNEERIALSAFYECGPFIVSGVDDSQRQSPCDYGFPASVSDRRAFLERPK